MYLNNKMSAKKRLCEQAMQTALARWVRETIEFKCPQCGSEKISTRPDLRGKNPYRCSVCKHYFDQHPDFVCDCAEPSTESKCHDCPNFHRLLADVKAIAEELKSQNLG